MAKNNLKSSGIYSIIDQHCALMLMEKKKKKNCLSRRERLNLYRQVLFNRRERGGGGEQVRGTDFWRDSSEFEAIVRARTKWGQSFGTNLTTLLDRIQPTFPSSRFSIYARHVYRTNYHSPIFHKYIYFV